MCEAPWQRGWKATEFDASKLRHRAAPSDDSQHPEVALLERGTDRPPTRAAIAAPSYAGDVAITSVSATFASPSAEIG